MSETHSGSGDGSQSKRATHAVTSDGVAEVLCEHVTAADWVPKGKAPKQKVSKFGLLMTALHALMPFLNFQKTSLAKTTKTTLDKKRAGWGNDLDDDFVPGFD